MKLHYEREQEIFRLKNGEKVTTTEARKITEVERETLTQVVEEILKAAKADHYELKSAHLYFSKSNKRRSKEQKIHVYNW